MRPNHGVIRFPAPASTSAFQPGPAVSLRPPSIADLRRRLHPPASFSPPPEFNDLRPAPRVSKDLATFRTTGERLPWGFVPHRGINRQRRQFARNPSPDYVPPSAFRTPSTVCSATSLAGLFHPATTSRVCPSGVCPSPRSRTGFPRPIHALWPLNAPACDQRMRPRLQGLAPRGECGVVETG
jgi:hypothetical protein